MRNLEAYLESIETIEAKGRAIRAGQPPVSYTEELLANQNSRIKKLGMEVNELVREDARPDFDLTRFVGEAADTIYSLEVMVAARGLRFVDALRIRSQQGSSPRAQAERSFALNQSMLLKSLGASASGVIFEECRADFQPVQFLGEVAETLCFTDIVLAGKGLTAQPVIDELIARNQAQGGQQ